MSKSANDLMSPDVWKVVINRLCIQDRIACLSVCLNFNKITVNSLKQQDRLWIKSLWDIYDYDCFDKNHVVKIRDHIIFRCWLPLLTVTSISKLFPSLTILKFDPPNTDDETGEELPDYREEKEEEEMESEKEENSDEEDNNSNKSSISRFIYFPLRQLFPNVTCFILPGSLSCKHFDSVTETAAAVTHLLAGDVSMLKDNNVDSLFPSLESLEVTLGPSYETSNPRPSKRLVIRTRDGIMNPVDFNILQPSLETLVAPVLLSQYDRTKHNHFKSLSIVKFLKIFQDDHSDCSIDFAGFTKFMNDHLQVVKDLSFYATGPKRKQIKSLLPYLSMVKKLEITVEDCDVMTILKKKLRKYALSLEHLSFRFKFSLKNNLSTCFDRVFKQLPDAVDNITIVKASNEDTDKLTKFLVDQILCGNPMTITLGELYDVYSEYLDSLTKYEEAASITSTSIRYIDEPCCGCGTRNNHVFQVRDIQITRKE